MATEDEWERLLAAQRRLQEAFPDLVLVGGTASALHARHRRSLDGDHVLSDLREHFAEVVAKLEELAGWKTNRLRPPVLVLGNFEGVETGIRQLVRTVPLETDEIAGIKVPTLEEMVRVKAWLVVTRNALRDYVDLCALAHLAGPRYVVALRRIDELYPQTGTESVLRQLAKQLAEPLPYDLVPGEAELRRYRDLRPPWDDWRNVERRCEEMSNAIANLFGLDPDLVREIPEGREPGLER